MWRIIIPLAFLLSTTASAQTCPKQDYQGKTQPNYECESPGEADLLPDLQFQHSSLELKVGTPTPWPGILMDKDRAIQLGLRIKALRRLRYLDGQACREKQEMDADFFQKEHQLETNALRSSLEVAQQELKNEQKWYKSVWFGVGVGVVITAGVIIGGALAIASIP
jgi:hypothetical protein